MGWVRAGWQRGRGREKQKKEQNGGRPLSWLTILPDAKIRAVVLGSRMRMMTAAKRCGEERTERGCVRNGRSLARGRWRRPRGRRRRSHFCPSLRPAPPSPPPPHPLPLFSLTLGLYSALRACRAMFFRSSLQSRLTVATTFWRVGTMPDGWRARSTVSGAPAAAARVVEGPAASAMRRCACARRCALGSTAEKRRARGVGEGERNGGGGPRKAVGRPARACSCAFPLSLSVGGAR